MRLDALLFGAAVDSLAGLAPSRCTDRCGASRSRLERLVDATNCESRAAAPVEARLFDSDTDELEAAEAGSFAGEGRSKPPAPSRRLARVHERPQARLTILAAVVVAATLLSSSSSIMAQSSVEKQAQCELSAIRDTRSAVAIQFIRSACNWLALNGDSLLNEASRNYYVCLVRQLSGVQADEAAGAIVSACRTSNPP
jgi:hypothetical protein